MKPNLQNNPKKALSPISLIVYNIMGLAIVFISHALWPTGLAGPGLDILFLFGYIVFAIVSLIVVSRRH